MLRRFAKSAGTSTVRLARSCLLVTLVGLAAGCSEGAHDPCAEPRMPGDAAAPGTDSGNAQDTGEGEADVVDALADCPPLDAAALDGATGLDGHAPQDAGSQDTGTTAEGGSLDASCPDCTADGGQSPGSFTIAVLPDTQNTLPGLPEIFDAQTFYLADNAETLNLQMVVHVGDVVNFSWQDSSWTLARDSMAILEGTVPYIIAPGNHDYGATEDVENAKDRSTRIHSYFPRSLFESMPTFGGFWNEGNRIDNSFHTFEWGSEKWVVLALEFGPRQQAIDWAHWVLESHSDHHALIATHAYLYVDGERYDWAGRGTGQRWNPHSYGLAEDGDAHDGEELWDELVAMHSNIVAVVCGHAHGNGTTSAADNGVARLDSSRIGDPSPPVVQMLANYQDQPEGGGGFLRLLTIDPEARTVDVSTYSPYLDQDKDDPENAFRFSY